MGYPCNGIKIKHLYYYNNDYKKEIKTDKQTSQWKLKSTSKNNTKPNEFRFLLSFLTYCSFSYSIRYCKNTDNGWFVTARIASILLLLLSSLPVVTSVRRQTLANAFAGCPWSRSEGWFRTPKRQCLKINKSFISGTAVHRGVGSARLYMNKHCNVVQRHSFIS